MEMWNISCTKCHKVVFGLSTVIAVPLVFGFTTFLLLFPIMEMHLPRMSCWASWHMRLKLWYDAYGGPYKDEYRFWTGLLLLVRCGLVLAVTIDAETSIALSILMWLCLLLIPLVALLQVYNSSLLNVLEIVYLSCLLAMASFSNREYNKQVYIVMNISLCLFIAILVFHSYQQVKCTRFAAFICTITKCRRKHQNASQEVPQINQEEEGTRRIVPVSIIAIASLDEEREPLLAE